jgi:hypothetical protein
MYWTYDEQVRCWEARAYGWRAMVERAPQHHVYFAAVAPFDMPDRMVRSIHTFSELRDAQAWCIGEIMRRRQEE